MIAAAAVMLLMVASPFLPPERLYQTLFPPAPLFGHAKRAEKPADLTAGGGKVLHRNLFQPWNPVALRGSDPTPASQATSNASTIFEAASARQHVVERTGRSERLRTPSAAGHRRALGRAGERRGRRVR